MTSLADGKDYLVAELRRLDVLLHREFARLRAVHLSSADALRGLYVSDRQVDALLQQAQNHGRSEEGQSLPDADAT